MWTKHTGVKQQWEHIVSTSFVGMDITRLNAIFVDLLCQKSNFSFSLFLVFLSLFLATLGVTEEI
jgi:uncharacterized membrane protein YqjE